MSSLLIAKVRKSLDNPILSSHLMRKADFSISPFPTLENEDIKNCLMNRFIKVGKR